jgi:hypothetical protein
MVMNISWETAAISRIKMTYQVTIIFPLRGSALAKSCEGLEEGRIR